MHVQECFVENSRTYKILLLIVFNGKLKNKKS